MPEEWWSFRSVMSYCPPSLVHTSFGGQSIFGFARRNMLALSSNVTLEVPVGIAPTHGGFADPCLTAWRRHQNIDTIYHTRKFPPLHSFRTPVGVRLGSLGSQIGLQLVGTKQAAPPTGVRRMGMFKLYFFTASGSLRVNPSKIAKSFSSSASSIATGVVAVTV